MRSRVLLSGARGPKVAMPPILPPAVACVVIVAAFTPLGAASTAVGVEIVNTGATLPVAVAVIAPLVEGGSTAVGVEIVKIGPVPTTGVVIAGGGDPFGRVAVLPFVVPVEPTGNIAAAVGAVTCARSLTPVAVTDESVTLLPVVALLPVVMLPNAPFPVKLNEPSTIAVSLSIRS